MQYKINKKWRNAALAVVLSFSSVSSVFAFTLDINFVAGSTFSATQQNIINSAANYWESVITGYQPGAQFGTGISINADNPDIDGPNVGTLGSAGPDTIYYDAGYWFTSTGSINLDRLDVVELEIAGKLYDVALHMLAHIIGFGTLWDNNGLYINDSGEYTGAAALAAYQAEFDGSATFIPVELYGGPGTANEHWDESIDEHELMTAHFDSPNFISDTTLASFIDLGYTVNLTAVPLPAAVWLFGSGLLGLVGWSKRKQAA